MTAIAASTGVRGLNPGWMRESGVGGWGVGVWLAWLVVTTAVGFAIQATALVPYGVAVVHTSGLAVLLCAYWVVRAREREAPTAMAVGERSHWVIGCGAVAAMYIAVYVYSKLAGIEPEPYMKLLYVGKSSAAVTVFLLSVCLIVPVAEELAFRYFLLGAMPVDRSQAWRVIAVVVSALIFMGMHLLQYQRWTTALLMFSLGLVFGWARLASAGLVLPVVMHAQAAVMGLVFNEFP